MKAKIGTVARVAVTGVLAAWIGVPAVAAGGICGYTAFEAYRACQNDAWDNFHETRGKCVNDRDRADRRVCLSQNSRNVREALELCGEQHEARRDVCDEIGNGYYDPDFEPEDFVDPNGKGVIENPFWSLAAGHTAVLRSDDGEELVVTYTTDRVKEIEGVPCRVVVDVAVEIATGDAKGGGGVEYVGREVTDDWYALHRNGDVWYCGELSRNFEDGELTDLDGSFTAGKDGAQAGVLIRANPIDGEVYRQEFALAEAEDLAQVLSTAASPPAAKGGGFACNDRCLQTRDFTPIEPGKFEHKYYLPGIGFVLAIGFEDGEEDGRELLACTGDSLDVLTDPACGILDSEALRDTLCELSPKTFCAD